MVERLNAREELRHIMQHKATDGSSILDGCRHADVEHGAPITEELAMYGLVGMLQGEQSWTFTVGECCDWVPFGLLLHLVESLPEGSALPEFDPDGMPALVWGDLDELSLSCLLSEDYKSVTVAFATSGEVVGLSSFALDGFKLPPIVATLAQNVVGMNELINFMHSSLTPVDEWNATNQ